MIKGKDTNKVYFSEILSTKEEFFTTYQQLTLVLNKHNINIGLLKNTNDIWCRDYMPIQKSLNQFTQFRYEPSYLEEERELQSNPKLVNETNSIEAIYSNINLDGGNVVSWDDRVILTDRVFNENPEYSNHAKLIKELEELFEAEVIIVPQIKSDMTGHIDGLLRFVDRNTLIGNDRNQEFKYWSKGINGILQAYNLDYIDAPFFEHKDSNFPYHAFGCYMNYLEVENLIVLPIFEVEGNKDQAVLELFQNVFPERAIETINYNEVGKYGGLLNCTTWTILEQL